MMFPTDCFGPHTLGLMMRVLDAAWEEADGGSATNATVLRRMMALRMMMALRIMSAVREGQRDPVHLKKLALEVIAKH